ncbi:hypothetical protein pb186bvf_018912 [Paramecium bursaria]
MHKNQKQLYLLSFFFSQQVQKIENNRKRELESSERTNTHFTLKQNYLNFITQ